MSFALFIYLFIYLFIFVAVTLFLFFLNLYFFISFLFLKSLLVACPTHANPPSSGLGTGGILFDKHIDERTQ